MIALAVYSVIALAVGLYLSFQMDRAGEERLGAFANGILGTGLTGLVVAVIGLVAEAAWRAWS